MQLRLCSDALLGTCNKEYSWFKVQSSNVSNMLDSACCRGCTSYQLLGLCKLLRLSLCKVPRLHSTQAARPSTEGCLGCTMYQLLGLCKLPRLSLCKVPRLYSIQAARSSTQAARPFIRHTPVISPLLVLRTFHHTPSNRSRGSAVPKTTHNQHGS